MALDCLISTMGFAILVRLYLYIESGPRFLQYIVGAGLSNGLLPYQHQTIS